MSGHPDLSGGSIRRFDNFMDAWRYVCANRDPPRPRYVSDVVATLQTLQPPPGFFIPPPMYVSLTGALVSSGPRGPSATNLAPERRPEIVSGDNIDPTRDPVCQQLPYCAHF